MKTEKLIRLTSILAITVSTTLIVIKLFAFLITSSSAVLASLLDSVIDSFTSAMNYIAIIYSSKPSDADHSFGHNAIEDIACLAQGCFIFGSGVMIIIEAVKNLITHDSVTHDSVAIIIMLISMLLTALLAIVQVYTLKRTESMAISADHVHYKSDIFMNFGVIVSLILTKFTGLYFFDSIFSIAIAMYIIYSSWGVGKGAFDNLMAKSISGDIYDKIVQVLNDNRIIGFHQLKTRRSGKALFVQVHVEIAKDTPFIKAHEIADDIERKVISVIKIGEVLIHKDPI